MEERRTTPDGLRYGWTTGTCAAGAAAAAFAALRGLGFPEAVTVRLPRGGEAALPLAEAEERPGWARAGIVKDAGDDPDVTHGCLVRATVTPGEPGSGVRFRAGEGVGTVTLPGLPLGPGEPAINPVPRAMIRGALAALAPGGRAPDVLVELAIPGGEALAARTLNGRLGIRGGLSILGTTGVVVPYSCSAWVHTIHRGIDVARAAGLAHLAAATGSTSERAVRDLHGLPEPALIEMGDFAGATLKYLRRHPVPRLTVAGGFGKLAKLAQGHLDLHSARSRVDLADLAAELLSFGVDPGPAAGLPTAAAVLGLAAAAGAPLGGRVAERARDVALEVLRPAPVAVEVVVVDRGGAVVGRAGGP